MIEFDGEAGKAKLQAAVPKFLKMGLGFSGRPADDSEHFARYFEMGLKLKTAQELQDEYLEIVSKRIADIGLELPVNIKPDYEMRVGYCVDETQPSYAGAKN